MDRDVVLPDAIRSLPVEERIEIARAIWDSVAEDESEFRLTPAQTAELRRRVAKHKLQPDAGVAWDELQTRLRSKSPCSD